MNTQKRSLGTILFEKLNKPLETLPILRRNPKISNDGLRRIYPEEINQPVMLWTNNDNKKCAVLALRGHGDYIITQMKGDPPIKNLRGTLQLFLNNPNWQYTHHLFGILTDEKDQGYLQTAINWHHNDNGHVGSSVDVCEKCEVINNWYSVEWLEELLKGNNPLLKVQL